MANKEIGDLTAGTTPLTGAELFHAVQGGNSRKITGLNLLTPTLSAADQASVRAAFSASLKGHIFDLTCSNNATDATNDIDIAAGEAASDTSDPVLMVLASALTKRLDAAWAVGTGNGGLDTGSIADTTYHVWLIRRSDTGVVDALFSTSATSPTMPTNYDQKRRIWSIIRAGGAILPFVQDGDYCRLKTAVQDMSVTTPGTGAVSQALTVPAGLNVHAFGDVFVSAAASGAGIHLISDLAANDVAPSTTTLSTVYAGASTIAVSPFQCRTNTSRQVRTRHSNANADVVRIRTAGWIDSRGRLN